MSRAFSDFRDPRHPDVQAEVAARDTILNLCSRRAGGTVLSQRERDIANGEQIAKHILKQWILGTVGQQWGHILAWPCSAFLDSLAGSRGSACSVTPCTALEAANTTPSCGERHCLRYKEEES